MIIYRLQVSGQAVSAKPCPLDGKTQRPPSELRHLEEEVFAQEGEYEEILAVDHRDMLVLCVVILECIQDLQFPETSDLKKNMLSRCTMFSTYI